MKVALLGPVGVGKGTQAQRVSERLNYTRIATGDLVRDQIEAGTELGDRLEGYAQKGEPVPDDIIIDLLRPNLQPAGGWLLDGVPRTVEQARLLDEELAQRGADLDRVIVLEGPDDDELIERVTSGRRQSQATGRVYHLEYDPPPEPGAHTDPGPFVQRDDETEEALRRQLETYHEEAGAIRDHYEERGILAVVDASKDAAETTEDILDALGRPTKR